MLNKYRLRLRHNLKELDEIVLIQRQQRGKPQILGIVGLSDVGKATLAKEFFSREKSNYSTSCFLSDVRDNAGKGSLISLQRMLLKSSTRLDNQINSVDEGRGLLRKLILMLESKAPIIPVFYHVKPSELRQMRGKDGGFVRVPLKLRWTRGKDDGYTRALRKLEKKKRYDPQTIESWRTALSSVADMSGFELEACDGDEGVLVDRVVKRVFEMVKKPLLDVATYRIGLAEKLNEFEDIVLLQRQDRCKPQIFGIMGLGGVGKTTLAKEFFNRKISNYSTSCFLPDVRDNADKGSLNSLQRKLLKSLTRSDNPLNSVDEGRGLIRKHLSSANALVILDDVDNVDQVYALLPDQTVLHSDSLVVITSRNKDVLKSSGVEESALYNLTGLATQHSLELFWLPRLYPPPPNLMIQIPL